MWLNNHTSTTVLNLSSNQTFCACIPIFLSQNSNIFKFHTRRSVVKSITADKNRLSFDFNALHFERIIHLNNRLMFSCMSSLLLIQPRHSRQMSNNSCKITINCNTYMTQTLTLLSLRDVKNYRKTHSCFLETTVSTYLMHLVLSPKKK